MIDMFRRKGVPGILPNGQPLPPTNYYTMFPGMPNHIVDVAVEVARRSLQEIDHEIIMKQRIDIMR